MNELFLKFLTRLMQDEELQAASIEDAPPPAPVPLRPIELQRDIPVGEDSFETVPITPTPKVIEKTLPNVPREGMTADDELRDIQRQPWRRDQYIARRNDAELSKGAHPMSSSFRSTRRV